MGYQPWQLIIILNILLVFTDIVKRMIVKGTIYVKLISFLKDSQFQRKRKIYSLISVLTINLFQGYWA